MVDFTEIILPIYKTAIDLVIIIMNTPPQP